MSLYRGLTVERADQVAYPCVLEWKVVLTRLGAGDIQI